MQLSNSEMARLFDERDDLRNRLVTSIEQSGAAISQSRSLQSQIDAITAKFDQQDRSMRDEIVGCARRNLSAAEEKFPRNDLRYARALYAMGNAYIAAYSNIERALPLLWKAADAYRLLLAPAEQELNQLLLTIAAQITGRELEQHYDAAERLFDELVPGCDPNQDSYPEVVRTAGDKAVVLANFVELLSRRGKSGKLKKLSQFILDTSDWDLSINAASIALNPKIGSRWRRARMFALAALGRAAEP